LGADVAKFTNATKTLIDLLNEHEKNQFPPRQRHQRRNFPLWVALRGSYGSNSKINNVFAGNARYPFVGESTPKDLIAEKLLKQKKITALQFAFINEYLCKHGYYNGHWAARNISPPKTVIPIGRSNKYGEKSIVDDGIEEWFFGVLQKIGKPITLRAILDDRVTDLILMKALDITAFRTNEHQKKRQMLHLLNPTEVRERLYPKKNWMYSGA
jgi:hypothetical protein